EDLQLTAFGAVADARQVDCDRRESRRPPAPAFARPLQLIGADAVTCGESHRRFLRFIAAFRRAVKGKDDSAAFGGDPADQIEEAAVAGALNEPSGEMQHRARAGEGEILTVAFEV